jgi:hypothetical protein
VTEYTFHRGIPIPAVPAPLEDARPAKVSPHPIYDQLVLERALGDIEGKALVASIHLRQARLGAA